MLIFWDRSNRQVRALQFVPVAVDVAVAEEVEFNHEDHEDNVDNEFFCSFPALSALPDLGKSLLPCPFYRNRQRWGGIEV